MKVTFNNAVILIFQIWCFIDSDEIGILEMMAQRKGQKLPPTLSSDDKKPKVSWLWLHLQRFIHVYEWLKKMKPFLLHNIKWKEKAWQWQFMWWYFASIAIIVGTKFHLFIVISSKVIVINVVNCNTYLCHLIL